jgi:NADH-quinone oxidoreductase subunit E
MLRGADELLTEICRHLDIEPGETTRDGSITLEVAECIGACEVAPCVLVNDECKGNLTSESALHLLDELRRQGGENGI